MREKDEEKSTQKDTGEHGHALTPGNAQARNEEGLIPKHGGYRNTKTWQMAELIYDITALFCEKYVDRRSRTHDQMVQAARSGSRNLGEGSMDSGTSKKIEMKLTGIARGSLDELKGEQDPLLATAVELERVALEDEYFVTRKLYPNVDFYSGLILRALKIPMPMFTVIFVMARSVGWIAQWKEMMDEPGQRISRPRQIYSGAVARDYREMGERD